MEKFSDELKKEKKKLAVIDCRYFANYNLNKDTCPLSIVINEETLFHTMLNKYDFSHIEKYIFIISSYNTSSLVELIKQENISNYEVVFADKELSSWEVLRKVKNDNYVFVNLFKFVGTHENTIIDQNGSLIYSEGCSQKLIYKDGSLYSELTGDFVQTCSICDLSSDIKIEDEFGNYYRSNKQVNAEKKYLLKNLKFDELDVLYNDNLDTLIYDYIIYLYDTGQLNKLIELNSKFDFTHLIKLADPKYPHIEILKFLRNSMECPNNEKFKFNSVLDNDIYRISLISIEEAQSRICSSNTEHNHVLTTHILNEAIREKSLTTEYITKIVYFACKAPYNPIRKKYVATKITCYLSNSAPHLLRMLPNTGQYNYVQKLHFLLSGCDFNRFKPGIRRVEKLLSKHKGVNIIRDKSQIITLENVDTSKSKRKRSPKVAVCISGAMRYDTKKLLQLHKENIITPLNADVYISTWNNAEVYPGLTGPSTWDNAIWLEKLYAPLIPLVPEDIKRYKDFKNTLPNVFNKVSKAQKKEISSDDIYEVLPNAKVSISDEIEFEEKYDTEEMRTRDSLNQAKMFYGIWKAQDMVDKSGIDYDYVIRVRIDYVPNKGYSLDNLLSLEENELGMSRDSVVGPTDICFSGSKKNMDIIASIWPNAVHSACLCPITIDNKKAQYDSHKLLESYMADAGLITNTENKVHRSNRAVLNIIKFPDVKSELELDLKNINEEDHEKYRKFFMEAMNFNK